MNVIIAILDKGKRQSKKFKINLGLWQRWKIKSKVIVLTQCY